jgi:hypothetical protein
MTGPPASGPTRLENFLTGVSAVLSQFPWIATLIGLYPASIYQPGVYADGATPWFLIVPAIVWVFASWLLFRRPRMMWWLFALSLILAAIVAWLYFYFPADAHIHKLNWILSYCVVSLFVALVFGFILDLVT